MKNEEIRPGHLATKNNEMNIVSQEVMWDDCAQMFEYMRVNHDSNDSLIEHDAEVDFIGDVTNKKILDIGCGMGRKTFAFVDRGASFAFGVDVSGINIDSCIKSPKFRKDKFKFIKCDVNKLSSEILAVDLDSTTAHWTFSKFDKIIFFHSISYVFNLEEKFTLLAKHLEDDGEIIVSDNFHIPYIAGKIEQGMGIAAAFRDCGVQQVNLKWTEHETMATTCNLFSQSEFINAINKSGLYIQECREPEMSEENRKRYQHKAKIWDNYGYCVLYRIKKLK